MYSPYTYVIFQTTMAEELPKHVFYKKCRFLSENYIVAGCYYQDLRVNQKRRQ